MVMLFIFDMGGVVTTTFGAKNPMFERLGMSSEDFYTICNISDLNIWNLLQIGKISVMQFWTEFNKRVGSLQRELFDGIIDVHEVYGLSSSLDLEKVKTYDFDLFRFCFHPQLNRGTVEIIEKLKKNGHRVICGTNTIDSHWENHMERGDYSYFNQTYASNKIGFAKPDKNFWLTIIDYENYKPEETFFTDDREDNCQAAAECGINVHQFTTAQDLKKAWSKYL